MLGEFTSCASIVSSIAYIVSTYDSISMISSDVYKSTKNMPQDDMMSLSFFIEVHDIQLIIKVFYRMFFSNNNGDETSTVESMNDLKNEQFKDMINALKESILLLQQLYTEYKQLQKWYQHTYVLPDYRVKTSVQNLSKRLQVAFIVFERRMQLARHLQTSK